MKFLESETTELKRTLNKDFAKEVVAFLNTRDGVIYIGVDDNGKVLGVTNTDKTMREVRDIIRDQILPSTEGLCEIGSLLEGDKMVVSVKVSKGTKLYYIKKEGRSATGCFYRDGTSSTPMSEEEIERKWKYSVANEDLLKETPASYSPLTFKQLKIFYDEVGMTLNDDTFASNLGLLTLNGTFNKIAELLSDKNHIGFIYARYNGKDKSSFSETVDFGNQCVLTAVEKLMYRLEAENRGVTEISLTTRRTKNLVDIDCLTEAVYNALAHNDWLNGGVPSVYVFNDRIEIISYGGLPFGQTEENFFKGISKPRSEGFMRILRDLDFAERTGHGIPQIIGKYGKKVFNITDSFILVTLPFDSDVVSKLGKNEHLDEHLNEHLDEHLDEHLVEQSKVKTSDRENLVIKMIRDNPYVTYDDVSSKLGVSIATVRRIFSALKKKGIIVGSRENKYAKWMLKDR